jgi:hypothetical protein
MKLMESKTHLPTKTMFLMLAIFEREVPKLSVVLRKVGSQVYSGGLWKATSSRSCKGMWTSIRDGPGGIYRVQALAGVTGDLWEAHSSRG